MISDKLLDLVTKVDILPSIKSDHSAIFLELEEINDNGRGPGYWKTNMSLLANEEYKNMINNRLPMWLEEAKDLEDPRSIWDWIKFNIKNGSIIFSKQILKNRRKREEESTCRYQESLNAFQEIPQCDNTRITMARIKNEFELLYDKKVEGIITRAKARWHEHGEKNSKYFLNLEKRNHIKKHIRKLYISGVISTDPVSIMNSQKQFYSKLYSSSKTKWDTSNSENVFTMIPNLPKLSSEASKKCEGRITAGECQNIIKNFPLGKTPGVFLVQILGISE